MIKKTGKIQEREFEDIDEAPAYLDLRKVDNYAFLFCHRLSFAQQFFPKERFSQGTSGWVAQIDRQRVFLRQEALFLASGKEEFVESKSGTALLPEEERVLFLWQSDGTLVVSSEDSGWSDFLRKQSYAKSLLKIERPGEATRLWRVPQNVFLLRF